MSSVMLFIALQTQTNTNVHVGEMITRQISPWLTPIHSKLVR